MKPGLHNLAFLSALLCAGIANAQEKITLHYDERPPYLQSAADGSAFGLAATPASNVFRAAGIPFAWELSSMNRQMQLLKQNIGKVCMIGFFKTPEREAYAKYTKPIYRDKPSVVLARKNSAINFSGKLEDALEVDGVRVMLKTNYVYGPYLDGLLAKAKANIVRSDSTNAMLLKLVKAGRADFMFAAEEEASYLMELMDPKSNELRMVRFAEMPEGEKRYISCSKQVPDEIIEKLNKLIAND